MQPIIAVKDFLQTPGSEAKDYLFVTFFSIDGQY
jgi:hypothetical protein